MNMSLKQEFAGRWEKCFPSAELPAVFYYADNPGPVKTAAVPQGHRCFIGDLAVVRYKKTPDLVAEAMKHQPPFEAPARHLIAKRGDALEAGDEPLVVVFFAPPDALSGLFTLANFDETQPDGGAHPSAPAVRP